MKRFVLFFALLTACPTVREGILLVTPGVPPRTSSDAGAGASRCNGAVPETRSGGRWWPATPAGAPCPYGCLVADGPDGGAYCGGPDAAVTE
jgi:hypothetical protein